MALAMGGIFSRLMLLGHEVGGTAFLLAGVALY